MRPLVWILFGIVSHALAAAEQLLPAAASAFPSVQDGGGGRFHLGLEHTFHQFLALRAGHSSDLFEDEASLLPVWALGGGLIFRKLNFDYAYVPLDDLGNMQRVSLAYLFSQDLEPASSVPDMN
jgi:hypothetical protein